MKDTLIDIALITVGAMFAIAAVVHIISFWGEPSEIIGTAVYTLIN